MVGWPQEQCWGFDYLFTIQFQSRIGRKTSRQIRLEINIFARFPEAPYVPFSVVCYPAAFIGGGAQTRLGKK